MGFLRKDFSKKTVSLDVDFYSNNACYILSVSICFYSEYWDKKEYTWQLLDLFPN